MGNRISSKLLDAAFAEARRRGEGIIHPEHLLIAVVDSAPLRKRGVSVRRLQSAVDELRGPSPGPPAISGVNDTTSRILAAATSRAIALRNGAPASPEDVLFALLDEAEGPSFAVAVLQTIDIDVAGIRVELEETKG